MHIDIHIHISLHLHLHRHRHIYISSPPPPPPPPPHLPFPQLCGSPRPPPPLPWLRASASPPLPLPPPAGPRAPPAAHLPCGRAIPVCTLQQRRAHRRHVSHSLRVALAQRTRGRGSRDPTQGVRVCQGGRRGSTRITSFRGQMRVENGGGRP